VPTESGHSTHSTRKSLAKSEQLKDVTRPQSLHTRRTLTLTAACVAQGMMVLDVMIVNVALPSIQADLHMTPGALEWVVSAYALALATLIPFGGALGDRFGRKRVFLSGIALFVAASASCALSTSAGMLIASGA
jgi:MFS family permease